MNIYLAVWEDRHMDNKYMAFRSVEDAIIQCKRWAKSYKGHYRFKEQEVVEWEFYIDSGDDCPSMHVEKIDLELDKGEVLVYQ